MGIVERYYAPLRRAYEIVTEELRGYLVRKPALLQMAVKAVNDIASPNGLVPTLLVFRTYLRMSDLDPFSSLVS